jgi:hypothetical protein
MSSFFSADKKKKRGGRIKKRRSRRKRRRGKNGLRCQRWIKTFDLESSREKVFFGGSQSINEKKKKGEKIKKEKGKKKKEV